MINYKSYPNFIDWSLVTEKDNKNDYLDVVARGHFDEMEDSSNSNEQQETRAKVAMLNIIDENKMSDFRANRAKLELSEDDILEKFIDQVYAIPMAQTLLDSGTYPDEAIAMEIARHIKDEDLYNLLKNSQTESGENALVAFAIAHHASITGTRLENFNIYLSKLEDNEFANKVLTPFINAEVKALLDERVTNLIVEMERYAEEHAKIAAESNVWLVDPAAEELEKMTQQLKVAEELEQQEKLAEEQRKKTVASEIHDAKVQEDQASVTPVNFTEIEEKVSALEIIPKKSKLTIIIPKSKDSDSNSSSGSSEDSEEEEEKFTHPAIVSMNARLRAAYAPKDGATSQKPTLWERFKQKWNAVPTRAKIAAGIATLLSMTSIVLGVLCPPSLVVTVPLLKISSSSLMIYAGAGLAGLTLFGHAAHIASRAVASSPVPTNYAGGSFREIHSRLKMEKENQPQADISPRSPVTPLTFDSSQPPHAAVPGYQSEIEEEEEYLLDDVNEQILVPASDELVLSSSRNLRKMS